MTLRLALAFLILPFNFAASADDIFAPSDRDAGEGIRQERGYGRSIRVVGVRTQEGAPENFLKNAQALIDASNGTFTINGRSVDGKAVLLTRRDGPASVPRLIEVVATRGQIVLYADIRSTEPLKQAKVDFFRKYNVEAFEVFGEPIFKEVGSFALMGFKINRDLTVHRLAQFMADVVKATQICSGELVPPKERIPDFPAR